MDQDTKPRGVFDKKEEKPAEVAAAIPSSKKDDYKDPFREQQAQVTERIEEQRPKVDDIIRDSTLENTAAAVNNAGPGKNVQSDLDDMARFSDEDINLAEQMIFRGYAEFDAKMTRFPDRGFTICSTSAEEIAIIDEVVFDYVKGSESDDGVVNLPQNNVQGLKNALFIAISYRGSDHKELIEDSSCHLNIIKKGIIRISELEGEGKLKEAQELKDSLKKKLLRRATRVRRLATPLIDFLSEKKYEFDSKMLAIMSEPGILPKS